MILYFVILYCQRNAVLLCYHKVVLTLQEFEYSIIIIYIPTSIVNITSYIYQDRMCGTTVIIESYH